MTFFKIYNPNIFKFIDAILTRKCYNCHSLLFDDVTMQLVQHKLKNIDDGYLFDVKSITNQLSKLEEIKTQKITNNIFDNKKTKMKRKKIIKTERNHRSIHKSEHDSNSDDDEMTINASESDVSEDSDDANEQKQKQKNAVSFKRRLDFLDEGIMPGTRQSLLKLRWTLFELSCFILSLQLTSCFE